jgi:hypothetical protein
LLTGNQVPQLVAEYAGQLIFIAQKCSHFARNIDAPAGHAESLNLGLIVQKKLVVQTRLRKMLAYTIPDAFEIARDLIFFDDAEPALQLLADNLAEFLLLLRGKQKFRWVNLRSRKRRATRLGAHNRRGDG